MKFKLEIEDEERPFAGWAFLLFRNADPGFLFVDRLNRLYDYAFERIGDMELSGVSWPFYYFDDESNGLKYFLLQRPRAATDAPWSPMDKLLLVRGERAGAVAEAICDDFADSVAPDPADFLAVQRLLTLSLQMEMKRILRRLPGRRVALADGVRGWKFDGSGGEP